MMNALFLVPFSIEHEILTITQNGRTFLASFAQELVVSTLALSLETDDWEGSLVTLNECHFGNDKTRL